MLLLHEVVKIRKQINTRPEAFEEHLRAIDGIKEEYKKGLPTNKVIFDLITYARNKFINKIKQDNGLI